jgi:4-deoxy-L-threo-5-hexosulose-uronate ketol-isomerase
MEIRNACNPVDFKNYTTERLREDFLIQGLFVGDEVKMVISSPLCFT